MVFQYFTPELLRLDAAGMDLLIGLLGLDVVPAGTGTTFRGADGHMVTLVGGCASFNNVSTAMLMSVAMIMFIRPFWVAGDALRILGICAVMVAFNLFRLVAMAMDFQTYTYWHEGDGAALLATIQTVVIAGLSWLVARRGLRVRGAGR